MVVSALVGHVAERAAGDADHAGIRLTVDMVRMAAMEEFSVAATMRRDGRRLRLVDVVVEQRGRPVAFGRAAFARRTTQPRGEVWAAPSAMPPAPLEDDPGHTGPRAFTSDGTASENFDVWRNPATEKFVWFTLAHDLVEGEPMSDFVRAAGVADAANPLTNWGSEGLEFVNSDVTVHLARLPSGTAIGLAARDRQSQDGIAASSATMHDRAGCFGICTVTALASQVPMQPPRRPS
jgi:hypothetical protein